MNKIVVHLLTACLILSSSESFTKNKQKNKNKDKHHCCPPCPPPTPPPVVPTPLIVGTWILNETVNGIPSFSVLSAHADRTFTLHRSLSIQQPAPVDFPTGNYTTIDEGVWIQRSTTVFQVISTSVVNIITTGIPAILQATTPLARTQTTLNITVSADGNSLLDVNGATVLYEIDNLNFTEPLLNPVTGLPFVSDILAVGNRVRFTLLDTGP